MACSEGLDEWVLVAVSLADVFGRVCPLLDFDGGPAENKAERVDRLKRSLDLHVTVLTNLAYRKGSASYRVSKRKLKRECSGLHDR